MDEEIEVIGFDVEEQTSQKEQKQEQIEKVEVEAQSVQTTTAVEQQVESIQIEKPKKQRNIKKLGKRLIFLSVLLIPLFGYLYVIFTFCFGDFFIPGAFKSTAIISVAPISIARLIGRLS